MNRTYGSIACLCLVLIVFALPTSAAVEPQLADADDPAKTGGAALADFDAFLTAAVEEWNVPGLGFAAVVDGEVVFAEGFG